MWSAATRDFVYDDKTKACVKTSAGLLNDRQLYNQGRMLALAGYYEPALHVLDAVGNRDANVLTAIGYATRKLGHLDEGIALYHQALALDPANLNTHEYLGEGYLAAGRVDLAQAELDTLQTLCGDNCSQFKILQNAIFGDGQWRVN